ncbi:MAG: bifunctional phosphoribosylaminoimidazolecarboxamide formyltransferase/IMP cyclohydrolase [Verrucomicrobiales bacterium]|jgi:phosphoribosylaminoimidazolecarboxamide formyltransferase/IMP cyclohydrolase|nr:bifunctional phosphoribosylaminoimidazolecarboxamide formyltransferase/IMP cyclohydrolase [Verrucomicrobiales bacterium]
MSITRALISVSDKTGLESLAQGLHDHEIEILSTGGTAKFIADLGIPVIEVADFTGFPEMLDGRVKTLHPKVHGGLLFRRDLKEHVKQAEENDILPIDLVVVNLYPFEETVAKEGVTRAEAIEQIDIGGPGMLRSAAKNHDSVTVVVDPDDYEIVLNDLEEHEGNTTLKTRERLAIKVFQRTAAYDAAIASHLNNLQETTSSFSVSLPLSQELRYGENPHQEAALYGNFNDYFKQLQGKGLSYTNVIDIGAASELILEFRRPAVAILKHTNPCGVGADENDLRLAWEKAFETDRQAPFGGVIVCNRPLGIGLARVISEIFTDVIIAPEFETDARALLKKKKNLRLIQMHETFRETLDDPIIQSAPGGLLVMDHDSKALGLENIEEKVVTKRPPTAEEIEAMRFGWRIVKHVKSNAIVFTSSDRTLGIGAGQMSRVDSCRLATWKAEQAGLSLKGSVVASDAMFPFPDGLVNALEVGATAAIQPGGSIRDEEVIKAADEHDAAMVFTGHRHFLH